ncbi:tyrosine-type recombinase/integrase [Rhodohalobacter sp. 614A]|uniref:tyrosine-type recombinase/integrase n=1 Tax=Rhodohalobacter sp. 614A TaxID=2908649 RepID=UPI001F397A03|nr:site-specific integrase [Rhodohalobacter sp. 614A]
MNKRSKSGLLSIFDEHNEQLEKEVHQGNLAKSTWVKYRTICSRLSEFFLDRFKKEDLKFSAIKRSFSNDFHDYLVHDRKMAHNTAVTYVEMLGKIFRLAIQKNLIRFNPSDFYSHSKKENSIDYLSKEELEAIRRTDPSDEILQLVKDIFLFSCYTGLSFEEIKAVSTNHIQKEADSSMWLYVSRGDSWEPRKIPVLKEAQGIIDKYNKSRLVADTTLLFPERMPPSTGKHLNKLARLAGIMRALPFVLGRYTFATTVALEYRLPTNVADDVLGQKAIEKTDPYQQLMMLNLSKAMTELDKKLENKGIN